MKKFFAVMFTLGLITTAAQAKSYQAQGCGLGSTIWTDGSSLVHQVLGATTNAISGNQTFGMTSGTSNCELEGGGMVKAQNVFIEANRVSLANDIARGGGETLTSLTRMYGCEGAEVAPKLQQNYETIFSSETTSASEINARINSVLENTNTCS